MRHQYIEKAFTADSRALIETMNAIVDDYVAQRFRLTVRQLYYQLVAGAVVENTERSYKRITGLVNDAKMAGLMDWEAIEDRTRELKTPSRWDSTSEILRAVANQFHMDMWEDQPFRVFVIVEKEALAGVLEPTCKRFDVPLLAARGYPSGTVIHEFSKDVIVPAIREGQRVVLLHLGDHDPSGIDMTRDLESRIMLFVEDPFEGPNAFAFSGLWSLERIALNRDQVDRYKPPPNPAKSQDARFADYVRVHGRSSWELDALKPEVLAGLVEKEVKKHIDPKRWKAREKAIKDGRARLVEIASEEEGS